MLEQILRIFTTFYKLPAVEPWLIIMAIGLALLYGAIWLAGFLPPVFKNWKLWIFAIVSYIIPTIIISFIQYPVKTLIGQGLTGFLSLYFQQTAVVLMAGIIVVIVSGLIIEGAKLVTVFYYRLNWKQEFTPRFGLMLGALSGAVYGMMQAYVLHSQMAEYGIGAMIEAHGMMAILPYIERFFAVAYCAGTTSLAGYGLATGRGWKFYFIVSGINAVYSYILLMLSAKVLDVIWTEIIITLISLAVIGIALWLYWKKTKTVGNTH